MKVGGILWGGFILLLLLSEFAPKGGRLGELSVLPILAFAFPSLRNGSWIALGQSASSPFRFFPLDTPTAEVRVLLTY